MYVAVKGGEAAISAAHELVARERRGDAAESPRSPPIRSASSSRWPSTASCAKARCTTPISPRFAIKQARGDLIEAIFLLRAYRTTLPRFGYAEPVDTGAMRIRRRISATYKDLPGGQVLGPTFDYTHRLLDLALRETPAGPMGSTRRVDGGSAGAACDDAARPRRPDRAERAGATRESNRRHHPRSGDLPGRPRRPPAGAGARRRRLPAGARLLHAARLRPHASVRRRDPLWARSRFRSCRRNWASRCRLADITLTECEMVNQFKGSADAPPQFTRGYGLAFGHSERKAMAMALVDRALRSEELGQEATTPAQDAGVRAGARRQRAGDRLRRAPEAAALRRLPGRAGPAAAAASRVAGEPRAARSLPSDREAAE